MKSGLLTDELLREELGVVDKRDRTTILNAISEMLSTKTQTATIDASGTVNAQIDGVDDKYVPLEAVQGQYEEFVYPRRCSIHNNCHVTVLELQ